MRAWQPQARKGMGNSKRDCGTPMEGRFKGRRQARVCSRMHEQMRTCKREQGPYELTRSKEDDVVNAIRRVIARLCSANTSKTLGHPSDATSDAIHSELHWAAYNCKKNVTRALLQAEAADETVAFEGPVKVYGEELPTWDDLHELREEDDG